MFKICFLKFDKNIGNIRLFATKIKKEMKYLNVAEKNDAAKTIAGLLSNGAARRREGLSVYNKIYEFEATVRGTKSKMVMTSVSGHLLNLEFLLTYRSWHNCDPLQLFDATVRKNCSEDFLPIKKTLEREIKSCQGLIIWTDCDREGENIGFEIIEVCKAIKPNIIIFRAKFSEITSAGVRRALSNLAQPDKLQSDAVDVRSELDLRTGAAITRFQTMRLQRLFPEKIANKLISYGSCQIPTLGFVVERYKEAEAFVSEPFWKIKVSHTIDELTVDFSWARNRLFDKEACEDYLMLCLADPKAKVENVTKKPKNKWRPTPMDTVEMEKLGSRKLKLSAKETMTIAEKLYTKGIISYPRTETNMFSKEIDLKNLVEQQLPHSVWGDFARRVAEWGPNPRNGNKSDQAHPPIHPTKLITDLTGNEARVYELIVRHFLACVSKDATGSETIVSIDIAGEKFTGTGLCIFERNYLDVYIYEKWNAKEIHNYEIGQLFDPTEISMQEGATTAPPLLTEADLIALMEKHGIGTDATHAEHINTIKERGYIGVADRGALVPGVIGMGLYEGYDAMELVLAKPMLRAEFEADLKKICLGQKDCRVVLREQIQKYKEAYKVITDKIAAMDEKMSLRINETPVSRNEGDQTLGSENRIQELFECPKCQVSSMALRKKKDGSGFYIGCVNFPECRHAVWLSDELKSVSLSQEICRRCSAPMLKVKFNAAYYRILFDAPDGWYSFCLRCDSKFRETFNINADQVKRVGAIVTDAPTNSHSAASNSNLNSNSIQSGPSSSNSTTNNPGGSEEHNKRGSKKSTKITKKNQFRTIKHPGTRPFGTSAVSSATEQEGSSQLVNEADFFDSNDGFDDLLVNAELDAEIHHQQSQPASEANVLNDDFSSLFTNDDFADMSWGSAGRQNPLRTPVPKRSRVETTEDSRWGTQASQYSQVWQPGSSRFDNTAPSSTNTNGNTSHWGSNTNRGNDMRSNRASESSHYASRLPTNNAQPVSLVNCNCKKPASSLIVRKSGPNQGRSFYACADRNKSCGFFKWAEENAGNVQTETSWGTQGSTRVYPSTSGQVTSTTSATSKGRKCGICRQEGHTRLKCPSKT